ncbi:MULTISPECIES: glycosyltransferase [unclassified Microbacterium]|uniref:glycosyltransferase n=1 Tax=unclassified Microbacterium TaxID=2609290 RepID=UPI0006FE1DF0|nr:MULTISPECIES: glycosyltransferase [unclassified Microbacterium]AOX45609.1 glycosyl transferase family 2 [Microbacterium sp. BH-3-3-3]KQR88700.1 glycosyl transferase family 2 [Microbacterium sp. Leaf179]KQT74951.1 glycosyl transferase family 2 [Microbacterium sp. Leaf436]MBD8206884.1 glycosyltransferase [Microbacterium sp. CFBP 8801]MBD8217011.1 glycosyltransferase [Microbacterium sp. CFBP 13617]
MDLSVIVPTFNEGPNVAELVRRTTQALLGRDVEIIFVDDSTDDTPDIIRAVAAAAHVPVRLIHRDDPVGGLGGAVVDGIRAAAADYCVVMDGDLQHPPEVIAELLDRVEVGDADVVVASRYIAGGTSDGLANAVRTTVSRASTLLTKSMFPKKLHNCSDPMTGFFLIDRRSLDLEELHPRGFKILLEILARKQMRVAEVPFSFAPRFAGESKASFSQGMRFLTQLTMLRFGRMSAFALVGGIGAVANLAIMWALVAVHVEYILAAVIASVITIVANFLALEYLVFADMRAESGLMRHRFVKSFAFNGVEAIVRIPVIAILVERAHMPSVIAAALTLVAAFVVRFVFHALVVYAPKKSRVGKAVRAVEPLEDELTA